MFDVCNATSFENISKHVKAIGTHSNPNTPIILIGNKIDKSDRAVSSEKAQIYAQTNGFCYIETSVKTGQGCDEIETKLYEILVSKMAMEATLERLTKFQEAHSDNKHILYISNFLRECIQNDKPQDYAEQNIEALKQNLKSLGWTCNSLLNTALNMIATVFLACSIIGFPLAYCSGLLEANKQATGHSLMFFRFGEAQASIAESNRVFAEAGVTLRV